MNNGVHVSLSILVSLVCMPSSGIAGLYDGFIPSFLRNLHTSFIVAVSTCTPVESEDGFIFSTPSPAFIACKFLDSSHSDQSEST